MVTDKSSLVPKTDWSTGVGGVRRRVLQEVLLIGWIMDAFAFSFYILIFQQWPFITCVVINNKKNKHILESTPLFMRKGEIPNRTWQTIFPPRWSLQPQACYSSQAPILCLLQSVYFLLPSFYHIYKFGVWCQALAVAVAPTLLSICKPPHPTHVRDHLVTYSLTTHPVSPMHQSYCGGQISFPVFYLPGLEWQDRIIRGKNRASKLNAHRFLPPSVTY